MGQFTARMAWRAGFSIAQRPSTPLAPQPDRRYRKRLKSRPPNHLGFSRMCVGGGPRTGLRALVNPGMAVCPNERWRR